MPRDLFAGVPADVVVIDTGNYYPTRDGRIAAIEQGQPESAWGRRTDRPPGDQGIQQHVLQEPS